MMSYLEKLSECQQNEIPTVLLSFTHYWTFQKSILSYPDLMIMETGG
ncbi:MAG: hypothetical protein IPO94_08160 [Saprospiraceae bacterium]|nr:hypothetical protein [Saprospiraceae bacterium]